MRENEVRKAVRGRYGAIATRGGSCCGSGSSCCGGGAGQAAAVTDGEALGYSREDLASVPQGADLGLGCGNPLALAALQGGEVVLDLGSGAGFDCFLAARRVGAAGRVIGVDMTAEMVDKARENARRDGYTNVEFRLGEIENLPVADSSVDLIISNCVINLSVDKARVFREAARVLRPGGKLAISDIVLLGALPERVRESLDAYADCVSGALPRTEYLALLRAAGFEQVEVVRETAFGGESIAEEWGLTGAEAAGAGKNVVSISVSAVKPE